MKKKILYTILAALTLCVFLLVAVHFLIESEKIQQQIITRIEECYLIDASVEDLQFTYFPLPHIDLLNVEVQHEKFNLTIPSINIFPSWKIILGQTDIGHVSLRKPTFFLLRDFSAQPESNALSPFVIPASLPGISISILDGHVVLPSFTTALGTVKNNSLSNVGATLTVKKNTITVELDSRASFAEEMHLTGQISMKDLASQGTLTLNQLNLAENFKTADESPLALITDIVSLSSSFEYTTRKGFLCHFNGDIPDFTLTGSTLGDKSAAPVLIKTGKLDIVARKDFMGVEIQSLVVTEPRGHLFGTVAYYLPEKSSEKHVKIDLKGEDIDATSVRQKIMAVLGGHFVSDTVCEIVVNGHANSAAYYFDDTIASFENINAMTLDVDIEQADIHLKYVPIDLLGARGKIRIKDGDLTGWDITTRVGGSKGTNGDFLVGLGSENLGLKVDVDIDAELSELPKILREIVTYAEVDDELRLLSMTGRADGHLHIGDSLHDFKVGFDVKRFNKSKVRYNRLSWPIIPLSGRLQVTDSDARWQDLAVNVGNHIIQKSSGQISWTEADTPFSVTSLSGIFDTNTIVSELKGHEILKPVLDSVITSVVGSTRLVGTIKGHLFEPEEYSYDFNALLKNIMIRSPLLPAPLTVASVKAHVSDKSISFEKTSGGLLDNTLQINGTLFHDDWLKWQGDLYFNGELKQPIADWLNQKRLVPEKLRFRTPLLVNNMQVSWQDESFLVQGEMHPVQTDSTLNLKIVKDEKRLAGEFNIDHEDQKSQVRFLIAPANHEYDFYLNGTIPGQFLTDLLTEPFIHFNTITGKMNIQIDFHDEITTPVLKFSGGLAVTELSLLFDEEGITDHAIDFSLSGKNNILKINKLAIRLNDDFVVSKGLFRHDGWTGNLNLHVASPSINTDTVKNITDNMNTFIYERLGVPKKTIQSPAKYHLYSQCDFNFEKFTVPFGKNERKYQIPITPLVGQYTFNNSNSSLQIKDSNVCGLELEAFLSWFADKETSKSVAMQTPEGKTIEMRDFLECFNGDNIVIEGPLTFKALASTNKGTVEAGQFSLSSDGGYIYKFVAMAKALSILNIKGWSGSIWKKGYYYNQLELDGTIEDDVLRISKLFIDCDGVDLIGKGTFNLARMEYDMVFYVVPFASIGKYITKVPIVGRLLGGKEGRIISVPVKITGPALDPNVSVMDVGEIGEATGRWIWDTVTIPFDWTSDEKEEELEPADQAEQAIIPQGQ